MTSPDPSSTPVPTFVRDYALESSARFHRVKQLLNDPDALAAVDVPSGFVERYGLPTQQALAVLPTVRILLLDSVFRGAVAAGTGSAAAQRPDMARQMVSFWHAMVTGTATVFLDAVDAAAANPDSMEDTYHLVAGWGQAAALEILPPSRVPGLSAEALEAVRDGSESRLRALGWDLPADGIRPVSHAEMVEAVRRHGNQPMNRLGLPMDERTTFVACESLYADLHGMRHSSTLRLSEASMPRPLRLLRDVETLIASVPLSGVDADFARTASVTARKLGVPLPPATGPSVSSQLLTVLNVTPRLGAEIGRSSVVAACQTSAQEVIARHPQYVPTTWVAAQTHLFPAALN